MERVRQLSADLDNARVILSIFVRCALRCLAGAFLVVWSGCVYFSAEMNYSGLAGSASDRAINRLSWELVIVNIAGFSVCVVSTILTMPGQSMRRILGFAVCQTGLVLVWFTMSTLLLDEITQHVTHH